MPLIACITALRNNKPHQVTELVQRELGQVQPAQQRCYDAAVRPREFAPGQKVLFLLPSSADKLLVKWQGLYEVVCGQGSIDYDIHIPEGGIKMYHVNILMEREEETEQDVFFNLDLDMDWDEEDKYAVMN